MAASPSSKSPVLDVKILYPAIFSLLLISAAYAGERAPLYPLASPPTLNTGVVYNYYEAPGNYVYEMFAVPPKKSGSISLTGPVNSFGQNYDPNNPSGSSFDLSVAERNDNFGVRFVTLLRVQTGRRERQDVLALA
jgi:hypothetical protein